MVRKGLEKKKARLFNLVENAGSLLIAFSGGVDSTLLLAVAHSALGPRAVAATVLSDTTPPHEVEAARAFARERNIEHLLIPSAEMDLPEFRENSTERCYHCKKNRMEQLLVMARDRGLRCVADGTNVDDADDFRPGLRASRELNILAPLAEAGLTKSDIRRLSRDMGLPTWDTPSMACLATRIPYGTPITPEKLRQIADAETFLREKGFHQYRVRHHGSVARVEVEEQDLHRLLDRGLRRTMVEHLRALGFTHVAVDLAGYVSGSMNREIETESS